jgi:pimeloyl-ACP methyl ester carboxylesterase
MAPGKEKQRKKTTSILRTAGFALLALFVFLLAGFALWASLGGQPEAAALQALGTTEAVLFENFNGWLVYTPRGQSPAAGLILYPGGRVDHRAYAPLAQDLAAEGFRVVVVPMPLDFAFLAPNRATDVLSAFPDTSPWAIGGHSLGGAMAAEFAAGHPHGIRGLILWASYPASGTDLSGADLAVLSIFASQDGLATPGEIADSRPRLPENAIFVEIPGGNHAQFGYYGPQSGDGQAQIPREDQIAAILSATASFLQTLVDGS